MQDRTSFKDETGPGDSRVLVASGDLDFDAGGHMRRWVSRSLTHGLRRLVIDLSGAGYLDSRVLEALIAAEREAEMRGGRLAIVSPSDSRLRIIFELTRLDRYLRISDSRDAAFAEVA